MKIAQSSVTLSSSQISIDARTSSTNLRIWDNRTERKPSEIADSDTKHMQRKPSDHIAISPKLIEQQRLKNQEADQQNGDDFIDDIDDEWFGDIRLKIFKDLVEIFTGKEIKVYKPENDKSEGETGTINDQSTDPASLSSSSQGAPQTAGWGIDYQHKETHYTREGFSFEASGSIVTSTGAKIKFNTSLSMNREQYEELSVSLKAGDALIDPLMINFNGATAQLSNQKFQFDLNIDGILDSISVPSKSTGFLAYDKNGDGIINDGSELFGPSSGNGFSELATYDDDKNGWIDENDHIFSDLRIWEKDENGDDTVSTLLQKNVGAIYTGKASTNYSMLDGSNSLNGVLRQSGIWLNEKTGAAGIVSEVDLVV
ncbi:MAG TPA: hypothetical protein VHO70_04580 [Chitinispirillaceae bacterium]|nr:hypothetical protein [Chitinispirillaceae bacterium]